MVKEITDNEFESEVLKSDIPVFADFWATWCGPCQAAGSVIDEIDKDKGSKIKFVKMDVDVNPVTPSKYSVISIPTVIVFKGGQEVKRQVGFPGKEGFLKLIEEYK